MAAYEYTALDPDGKTRKGIIESDSLRQARQLLRDKQWAPLGIEPATQKSLIGEFSFKSPALNSRDLASITRQLATLIASGLPIEESIKAMVEQSENPKIVKLLLAVRTKILEGHSFASSLAEFPRAFSSLYRSTVAAGEKAGHLDLVLDRLADYTEARHESYQKVQLALLYPVILLVMSLLIVGGLLAYVVPKIVTVFIDTGQQLPMLTQSLISLSTFMSSYGLLLLGVVILFFLIASQMLKNNAFRLRFDRFRLKLPLLSKLGYGLDTARFASTLSILTSSGVDLVEAMKIATAVISNSFIKQRVAEAAQKVVEGESLKNSLAKTACFPPMMLYMIGGGEKSGDLDKMLARTARNQEKELENYINVLVRLFEPAMLLCMGIIVLLIVLAILLPIMNLNQLIR